MLETRLTARIESATFVAESEEENVSVHKLSYALVLSVGLLCSTARADLIVDLTTAGSSGSAAGVIGGAFLVLQVSPQSTGTGIIEPFLRIQANGNEGGYNTDAAVEYDAKSGPWTHALQLSDVPIVNIGGFAFREFLLDINQNRGGTNEFLSLNQIQLFQSPTDVGNNSETLIPATATAPPLIAFAGATEVFRLNNPTDPNTEILLNFLLNPGSGAGDMFLYVLNDAFVGGLPFVTMYAQFGTPPGPFDSNDGFEEWAVLRRNTPGDVPEPTSIVLFGSVTLFAALKFRKRFKRRA